MAITIVQQTSKATAGTVTTATTDAPGTAWTDGALLICCFRAAVVSSVTGGGCSGGWTLARAATNINAFSAEIWYGYNVGGGSDPVTVNFTSASNTSINVTELAGAATSGDPTDGVNGASGLNGTSMNSGNVTPTAGTEVIIFNCGGFQSTGTSSVAGPSGWTSLTGGAPTTLVPASYKIVSSASGSYNATYAIGYRRYGLVIAAFKAAAGGAYTLTASSGTFTETGTAANLEFGRKVGAASGTYTLTGTAANLEFGRKVAAASGTFVLTGTAATLTYGTVGGYTLAANGTSYTLTGTAANLEFGREVAAGSGTYALTGTAASLKCGRKVSAASGSYSLTGTAATLIYGQPGSYTLAANGATFTLTGTAAALKAARLLSASGGVFALTGTDATLIYGQIGNFTLSAEGGTFTLTGGAAALTAARRLSAAGATYTLTGMDAALKAGRRLVASGGAFTLTGTDADLVYSGARSTAFYVTGRSGVRYQIIEAASEPRYRVTRRE